MAGMEREERQMQEETALRATCHTMVTQHTFAKRVFLVAGIYGLAVLFPQYFMEVQNGRDFPPPINHPEYFYGFIGVALAWQMVFLLIARDVQRYRLFMLPAVLEKFTWGLATLALYAQGRLAFAVVGFGIVDLILGTLFLRAFYATRPDRR
jgi:hypothetical protein